MLVGALDDRFDISVKIRAVIQAAIAVIMMMAGNLHLSSLGFIFGSWELVLGPFGFFLTLFAVWAAINAFNMVDGIDGLLGGLSSVSFAATGIILWFDGQYSGDVVFRDDRRHSALYSSQSWRPRPPL